MIQKDATETIEQPPINKEEKNKGSDSAITIKEEFSKSQETENTNILYYKTLNNHTNLWIKEPVCLYCI